MTATAIDTNVLVEKFLPAARKRAREVARKLREDGFVADVDDLESDANLYLLRAANEYTEIDGKKVDAFFQSGLRNWAANRKVDEQRKQTRQQTERMEEDFDTEAPEYRPDDFYEELEQSERELVAEVNKLPKLGRELKCVVSRLLAGEKKSEVVKSVGQDRWRRHLKPALLQLLGLDEEGDSE